MVKKTFLAAATLSLFILVTSCTSSNVETQLLVACQGYSDALYSLEPFKPKMTERQLDVIRQSISAADPICTNTLDVSDPRVALDAVRAKLRELLVLQLEVKPV